MTEDRSAVQNQGSNVIQMLLLSARVRVRSVASEEGGASWLHARSTGHTTVRHPWYDHTRVTVIVSRARALETSLAS